MSKEGPKSSVAVLATCAAQQATGKRARTEDGVPACKQSNDKTPHVQIFLDNKIWSLPKYPWQRIDGRCYNVTLSEKDLVGVTIVPDSPTHFNVLPYGPKGMLCTDRDGCGGVVQRGQCLSWKYESLLHVECDTVCADVMVVNIDMQQVVDGNIEKVVCRLFHVKPDPDITQPCWTLGTTEANQRDSWENIAAKCNKMITEMQLQRRLIEVDQTYMLSQLQLHRDMSDSVKQAVTCPVCLQVVSDKVPSLLAPCGHFMCADCHKDYYHAIGIYDSPKCGTCQARTGEDEWQKFYVATGVAAALSKMQAAPVP